MNRRRGCRGAPRTASLPPIRGLPIPARAPTAIYNLPESSVYDGFNHKPYNRRDNDLDSVRTVPSGPPDAKGREMLERRWKDDGLYGSTYFLAPPEGGFSWDDLVAKAGGAERLDEGLRFVKDSPMVISTSPGLEESFGRFHAASPDQIGTLEALVARCATRREGR